jgi:ribonuclease HI
MNDTWTIFTDGGSRGNPGPAAYAYVIKRPGLPDIEEKCYLGHTTNNIAEYTGLVKALEHAVEIGGKRLVINSDSELMVKQMNGQYRVKNEGLKPLYEQASQLRKQFDAVTIKHVYREQNSQADALCNEAMDDRSPTVSDVKRASAPVAPLPPGEGLGVRVENSESGRTRPHPRPLSQRERGAEGSTPPSADTVKPTALMQALAVMKASAAAWAKSGDATKPAPVEVLNRIVEIMNNEPRP